MSIFDLHHLSIYTTSTFGSTSGSDAKAQLHIPGGRLGFAGYWRNKYRRPFVGKKHVASHYVDGSGWSTAIALRCIYRFGSAQSASGSVAACCCVI